MKQSYILLFFFVFVLSLTSCDKLSTNKYSLEYFVFKETKNDNYGFIRPDGSILYPDEFEFSPTCVCDGIFIVYENNGYSVYNTSAATPTLVNDLENLVSAGGCVEDRIPLSRKDSRIEVVNRQGNTIFTFEPINSQEVVSCNGTYSDGMLIFRTEDNKEGAVNLDGEVVVKPMYSDIYDFSEGYALVKKYINDVTVYSIIDKTGEVIFKYKEDWSPETHFIQDDYIIVNSGDRLLFVNTKGEQIKCPSKIKGISWYDNRRVIYRSENGEFGVMNRKDFEVILRAKYNHCVSLPWDGSKYLVQKDEKWQVVDEKGNIIINWKDDYQGVTVITSKGFEGFVGWEDNEYNFINKNGEKVKTSTDIYWLNNNTVANYTVQSNYFNVDGFVNVLTGMIGSDNIDGININSTVNEYIPSSLSPSSCTTYIFKPKGHSIEGFRYKIETKIEAKYSLSSYEYNYYLYYGRYEFRPLNPIDFIYLFVEGSDDLWDKTNVEIKNAMIKKGFELEKIEEKEMIFSKGEIKVMISSSYRGLIVKMSGPNSSRAVQ